MLRCALQLSILLLFMMLMTPTLQLVASFRIMSQRRNYRSIHAMYVASVQSQPTALVSNSSVQPELTLKTWIAEAEMHVTAMQDLLYPPADDDISLKGRKHRVANHPIYNFLHRYYRYSTKDLMQYSPGVNIRMEAPDDAEHSLLLNLKFLKKDSNICYYSTDSLPTTSDGRFGWISLSKTRDILQATNRKQAFFGCYGLHEWAMLYSGNAPGVQTKQSSQMKRHQEQLQLRVSQETIDSMVHSGYLRCTHFDAFRFFHPNAQPLNIINPLTRASQVNYEQPGCVHANMDLFKYAFRLYPFVSSQLLRDTLRLAIRARIIDMRASPYDVSSFEHCSEPLYVELESGRQQYAREQESLAEAGRPLRQQLLAAYETVLESCKERQQ